VVVECANVTEAVAALPAAKPDVVLLDYDLGEEQGSTLIEEMKNRHFEAKVLMVTAGMSDVATLQVVEAGASGIFPKHSSLDQLLTAIQRVAHGEIWMDTGTIRALVSGRNTQTESLERTRPLTDRQRDVMRGILDGLANKEIALRLRVSESSIKAVIQELFHKAGVRTRSQLVRIAIERHSSDWLKPDARY
jgi:DNA-binding NarL/FixJ family response regulator